MEKPRKGQYAKIFSFTVFCDSEEEALVRGVMQRIGTRSPQQAVMAVCQEFLSRTKDDSQEARVEELTYQRLYHDLAVEALEVRRQARRFLRALDHAKEYVRSEKTAK